MRHEAEIDERLRVLCALKLLQTEHTSVDQTSDVDHVRDLGQVTEFLEHSGGFFRAFIVSGSRSQRVERFAGQQHDQAAQLLVFITQYVSAAN